MDALKSYLLCRYHDELKRVQSRKEQANRIVALVLEDIKRRVLVRRDTIKKRQTMVEAIRFDITKRYLIQINKDLSPEAKELLRNLSTGLFKRVKRRAAVIK